MHAYFHAGESLPPPVVCDTPCSLEEQVYYIVNRLAVTLISCMDADFISDRLTDNIVQMHTLLISMGVPTKGAHAFKLLLMNHVCHAEQYITCVKHTTCTKQVHASWITNSKKLCRLMPNLDFHLVRNHVKLIEHGARARQGRKTQQDVWAWEQNEKLVQEISHQFNQYLWAQLIDNVAT